MDKIAGGWGDQLGATKVHWFVKSRSLCGKWMFFGSTTHYTEHRTGECAECRRCLDKLIAEQAAGGEGFTVRDSQGIGVVGDHPFGSETQTETKERLEREQAAGGPR